MALLDASGTASYSWVKALPDASAFPLYVYLNQDETLALGVYKRMNELALSYVSMADGSTSGVTIARHGAGVEDFDLMPDGVAIDSSNSVYVIVYYTGIKQTVLFTGIKQTVLFRFSYAGGAGA